MHHVEEIKASCGRVYLLNGTIYISLKRMQNST